MAQEVVSSEVASFTSFLSSAAEPGRRVRIAGVDAMVACYVVGQKAFVAGDFGSLVVTWPFDCRLVLTARATDGRSETSSAARPHSSRRRRTE